MIYILRQTFKSTLNYKLKLFQTICIKYITFSLYDSFIFKSFLCTSRSKTRHVTESIELFLRKYYSEMYTNFQKLILYNRSLNACVIIILSKNIKLLYTYCYYNYYYYQLCAQLLIVSQILQVKMTSDVIDTLYNFVQVKV